MVPSDVIIILIIITTDHEVENCCHNFSSNIHDTQGISLTLGLFKFLND